MWKSSNYQFDVCSQWNWYFIHVLPFCDCRKTIRQSMFIFQLVFTLYQWNGVNASACTHTYIHASCCGGTYAVRDTRQTCIIILIKFMYELHTCEIQKCEHKKATAPAFGIALATDSTATRELRPDPITSHSMHGQKEKERGGSERKRNKSFRVRDSRFAIDRFHRYSAYVATKPCALFERRKTENTTR